MTASELARFLGNAIFGTIRFRRGAAANLPALKDGEPGWTSDTHLLYVGSTSSGNILVTGSGGGGGAPAGTGYVHVTNGVYDTPSNNITATTNANLTGPITSVGNATSVAQQTGTGSIFAMQASPTFTTQIVAPKVIGGTSTSSTLTYQTTTAVGATGADHIFLVGNNGATEGMRIKNDGTVNATTFIGALTGNVTGNLTGNVTGNVSGSSGSCTGNAATAGLATALATVRTIGGSNFDGTANVTSFPSPGAIGGTTPAAGTFTALTGTSGSITGLTALAIRDTSAAFDVTLVATSSTTISAGRTLTVDVVNAARTLKLTGNPTLADWFDQSVKAGASPTFVTVTAALAGNATTATTLATARAIYGNNFDGSAALAQIIASTYGGTGNGFAKFSGPATSEKTFTLPNASATILTDNVAVTVAQGGTSRATATAYGPLFGGTTSTGAHQSAAAGTSGQVLKSGGASAVGAYADDVASFGITIDGGGAAITTGVKGYVNIPYACTITSATLTGDQTGSIVIDVWKLAFSTSALPTVSNTITASAKPTLSSAKGSQDTTLTGWTTSVSAGDTVGFNVDSCTTTTRATLVLKVKKS